MLAWSLLEGRLLVLKWILRIVAGYVAFLILARVVSAYTILYMLTPVLGAQATSIAALVLTGVIGAVMGLGCLLVR